MGVSHRVEDLKASKESYQNIRPVWSREESIEVDDVCYGKN